jgi:phosphoserine phosphatase
MKIIVHQRIKTIVAILLLTPLFYAAVAFANSKAATSSIASFRDTVLAEAKSLGAENVLVVYDLDNTLLTMKKDLGSDQWFNWQNELINKKDKTAVAGSFDDLLLIQYKIFALGDMTPVEALTVDTVTEIQNANIKSIILTARGPQLRNDVEQELNRAGLNFTKSGIGPNSGLTGLFTLAQVLPLREISYSSGVVTCNGLNKGLVLKELLAQLNLKFKKIFFLDDSLKNVENVYSVTLPETEIAAYHYNKLEPKIKAFEKDKSQAEAQWKIFKQLTQQAF